MSVDLPAPFSPTSACTSPRRTARLTSEFATTPGNRFVMPRSSMTGGSPARAGPSVGAPPGAAGSSAVIGVDLLLVRWTRAPTQTVGSPAPPGPPPYSRVERRSGGLGDLDLAADDLRLGRFELGLDV